MQKYDGNQGSVYTLLGYWEDPHTFISDNIVYEIWYNHMIKPELHTYYWVNIKYYPTLNVWGAFQIVNVPDDYKI